MPRNTLEWKYHHVDDIFVTKGYFLFSGRHRQNSIMLTLLRYIVHLELVYLQLICQSVRHTDIQLVAHVIALHLFCFCNTWKLNFIFRMSGTRQLRLLLWRNLLIQRRRPVSTVVELVLPCLFAALLVWMRTRVKTTPHPEITTWPEFRPDHFDKTLCPQTPFCPGAPWRLYYAPETAFTERLMARVMRRLGPRNVSGKEFYVVDFSAFHNIWHRQL